MKGDYFARHFGKEVTLCIDEYQAAAVDAHIDTLLIEQEAPNMNTTKSGYCAPATVQFSAIANTPTAALFNWKIYRQGEEDNPVVRFTGGGSGLYVQPIRDFYHQVGSKRPKHYLQHGR